jgi:hypothetical protein
MADSGESESEVELELLVHIAGAARAADDVIYRQLAQAYLDFSPGGEDRISIYPEEDLPSGSARDDVYRFIASPIEGATEAQSSSPSRSQPLDPDATSPIDTAHIIIDSQDLSFQSVEDNRSSPRLKVRGMDVAMKPATPTSRSAETAPPKRWETPPSQIPDSYPMPSTTSLYASPTRVLQQYLGLPATRACDSPRGSAQPPSSKWPSSSQSPPSLRRSPRRTQSQREPQQVEASSQSPRASTESSSQQVEQTRVKAAQKIIPVTPVAPKTTEMPLEDDSSSRALQAVFDITHVSSTDSSIPALPTPSRGESEPPPAKRPKPSYDSTARIRNDAAALIRSASDTGPGSSPSSSTLTRLQLSALEVFAPSPPVGIGNLEPSDMIPESLTSLADKLSSRYRPTSPTRDLDPLERGYWAIDCSSWSDETRQRAWVFLFRYIETGTASWGVWCRRSAAHDSLRLYCWGHLVKHTYLLLYLASERTLKYTGADWKDAEGKVVLQVPPLEKSLQK